MPRPAIARERRESLYPRPDDPASRHPESDRDSRDRGLGCGGQGKGDPVAIGGIGGHLAPTPSRPREYALFFNPGRKDLGGTERAAARHRVAGDPRSPPSGLRPRRQITATSGVLKLERYGLVQAGLFAEALAQAGVRPIHRKQVSKSPTRSARRITKAHEEGSLACRSLGAGRPIPRHTTSKRQRGIDRKFLSSWLRALRGKKPCLLTARPRAGTTTVSSRRRNKIIAPGWLRNQRVRSGSVASWNAGD
jgi:hypothetical protein